MIPIISKWPHYIDRLGKLSNVYLLYLPHCFILIVPLGVIMWICASAQSLKIMQLNIRGWTLHHHHVIIIIDNLIEGLLWSGALLSFSLLLPSFPFSSLPFFLLSLSPSCLPFFLSSLSFILPNIIMEYIFTVTSILLRKEPHLRKVQWPVHNIQLVIVVPELGRINSEYGLLTHMLCCSTFYKIIL